MKTNLKASEARREKRVAASLQARVNEAECLTRDVSPSGVFLESTSVFDLGEKIDFVIDLDSPGGKLILRCSGEVVRIEQQHEKMGVAVKIVESSIRSA